MTEFIGHFHPALVHLPIGILLLGCLFLYLIRYPRYAGLKPAVGITLILGSVSALLSCISGYLLSLGGDYDADLVGYHQNMALITTALSLLLLYVYFGKKSVKLVNLSGILVFSGLVITGHLGGSLTHGSDYLTSAFGSHSGSDGRVIRDPIPDVQQAQVYGDVIQPILRAKCYTCHGPNKQKGKLRLDEPDRILKGGKDGKVVIRGNASKSELIKRLLLSRDDEDHMPPKEKSQLRPEEIALIHWWIDNGPLFDKMVKDIPQPESIRQPLLTIQNPLPDEEELSDYPADPVQPASPAALDSLRVRGIVVVPIAQNSNYLMLNFVTVDPLSNEDLRLLLPLREQIVSLNLSGKPIRDSALSYIGQCRRLVNLQLDHTAISDAGLPQLNDLAELRRLNLGYTRVTGKGLQSLNGLKKLRNLYLYQSGLTPADWPALKTQFPNTEVDSGNYRVPTLASDTTVVKAPELKK